nr:MAG TPA: hypothetical protein [Caudoviricetes sp.]
MGAPPRRHQRRAPAGQVGRPHRLGGRAGGARRLQGAVDRP